MKDIGAASRAMALDTNATEQGHIVLARTYQVFILTHGRLYFRYSRSAQLVYADRTGSFLSAVFVVVVFVSHLPVPDWTRCTGSHRQRPGSLVQLQRRDGVGGAHRPTGVRVFVEGGKADVGDRNFWYVESGTPERLTRTQFVESG